MLDEIAQGLANNIAGSSGEKSRGQFARMFGSAGDSQTDPGADPAAR
jgi:hypothetical protein